ncbi:MAG: hypothetical protein JW751_14125 [Polyangiaceae bacterium]|nr:hypothetical protein [Polyangiaceae bacterium]
MSGFAAGLVPGATRRNTSLVLRGGGFVLTALAIACTSDPAHRMDQEAVGGAGGAAPAPPTTRVEFAVDGLEMAPGEARELNVKIEPPGVYRVRFALLGDALDASLDSTEVATEPDGTCSVGITAPTNVTNTPFRIRASVGTQTAAEIEVSVASNAPGTLIVVPEYRGSRPIQFWVASAHPPPTTCAALTGTPPADGSIMERAGFGYHPALEIPAGRALAVTLRGEEKVGGCLDVPPLTGNEVRTITVPLTDVPLRMTGVELELTVDLRTAAPAWPTLLVDRIGTFSNALLGSSTDDLDALLDAMLEIAASSVPDADFAEARDSGGWDGALASYAGTHGGPRLLRNTVEDWLATGVRDLEGSAWLEGSLSPQPGEDEKANLLPTMFAGFAAETAGFGSTVVVSWQSEPGDQLLLGANVPWASGAYLAAIGTEVALAEHETYSVGTALAQVVDCTALGQDLQVRALGAMRTCDPACTARVCSSALEALWERAEAAASTVDSSIELSATAAAVVDPRARPTSFTGEWVGRLTIDGVTATGSGSISGETPPAAEE